MWAYPFKTTLLLLIYSSLILSMVAMTGDSVEASLTSGPTPWLIAYVGVVGVASMIVGLRLIVQSYRNRGRAPAAVRSGGQS